MKKAIGIYIGRREVIVASVFQTKGAPELDRFAIEAIRPASPESEGSVPKQKKSAQPELGPEAQAVERALGKTGALRTQAVVAFSPFHLATRFFKLPPIPRREWEDIIRFEARRYLPFKLSDTVFDHHVSLREGEGKALLVTATAAKRETIDAYLSYLRRGSAKVGMIEPVFSALARAVHVSEPAESAKVRGYLFIDSDGGVNITLASKGAVYLSRDFLLSEDQVTNQGRFYQELKASFEFVHETCGESEVEKVFLAGSGDLVFWSNFLTSVFGKHTSFEVGLFPVPVDVPKGSVGALVVPIGLALRVLNYKSPLGTFSLLPPEERLANPGELRKLVVLELLTIAFLFILARLLILEPFIGHMRSQAMRQLSPEAGADQLLAHESLEKLRTIQTEAEENFSQANEFFKNKISMSRVLSVISGLIPKSVWLDQVSYQGASEVDLSLGMVQGQRSLVFEGLCYMGDAEKEVEQINKWGKDLNADPDFRGQFKRVVVEEMRREKFREHDITRFRIACR